MTEQDKITIFDALIKSFLRDDSQTSELQEDNMFALAIRLLLNSSLRAQQDEHLGCERYERMATRNGQRNGFKPRTIRTSSGQITQDIPQVRNSKTPFTSIVPGGERGSRIGRTLNLAITEMYLQGVSTRKVTKVLSEHWTTFIQILRMGRMNRTNCITSANHKRIRNALTEKLPGVLRQRQQFHFLQNTLAHMTSVRYLSIMAEHIRNVFNARNRTSTQIKIQNTLSILRADNQHKLTDCF